ncbi:MULTISPECIES: D-aminoacyl-tRNA deacylase [Nitrincola]|uniref:D-aminoacyl-tRNA deacylase n=1 Tax=Nitrincola nitratireducens TaxID=1229521 RepID=W9UQA2_9GAMM|nr:MULTISPECIES: D-aminoacyl-tRNA deacylase [Nitrincola]EXJ09388.1 D-tyrosyl-tRNA(Tyr) deacylase [Nitrincola nitratireducens]
MKGLIQRVQHASVHVDKECIGNIHQGLLLLLGIEKQDTEESADKMIHKVLNYRVFSDETGRMNLNVQQVNGGLLIVSQFTLVADTKKGLRPGFSMGAAPEQGEALYDYFVQRAQAAYQHIGTGQFGADMQVSLLNDGPVTFLLET